VQLDWRPHLSFLQEVWDVAPEPVPGQSLGEEPELLRADLLVDVVDDPRPERGHVEVVHLPAGAVTIWRARNGRCSWLRTSVWLISLSFALKK
jgi:hypothetical protein